MQATELRIGNYLSETEPDGWVYYVKATLDFIEALQVEPGCLPQFPVAIG
jgi:hypothetical protein